MFDEGNKQGLGTWVWKGNVETVEMSVDSVDEHIRFSESGVPPTLIRFVFIFPTKNIEKHHTTRGVYHVWDPFSERPMIS